MSALPKLARSQSRGCDAVCLWVAQGFGLGRIPWAPGTLGSLLGVLWFLALASTGSAVVLWMGTALGLGLSVAAGHRAEQLLGCKDPGSIVIDEVTAMPVCYLGAVYAWPASARPWFDSETTPTALPWWMLVAGFAFFRLFDIWKPWPVRQSQSLPGGWGLTVDDFLAAIYVNLALLASCWGLN